ncbi:hypothetical protein EJB05_38900, partial [Eragrostis curvula]
MAREVVKPSHPHGFESEDCLRPYWGLGRIYRQNLKLGRHIELKTAPADFRFPTTNQTRHCFTRYVEYHRCVSAKGDEAADCEKFAKYYALFAQENGLRSGTSRGRMGHLQGPCKCPISESPWTNLHLSPFVMFI